ncbi:excalibur calcium-binding domain-containing protein [Kocuria sp. CPCC 205268]|uniref:excalibur calcium-binding domain-containing protein n=1 Tax=Kocuria oxytropis TaxID=3058913 RepID=UPI0034D63006
MAALASTGNYANCFAARSAGAAPVYLSQPGYGLHVNRDGDAVACEKSTCGQAFPATARWRALHPGSGAGPFPSRLIHPLPCSR